MCTILNRSDLILEIFRKPGFGTWRLAGDECITAVADAIEIGYRHIDTARTYGNEAEVGQGVRRSGIDREAVFVATKLELNCPTDEVIPRIGESLKASGFEYFDQILMHWPNTDRPSAPNLHAMEQARMNGMTRYIGVSNFTPALFAEAAESFDLTSNQVELHPFLSQRRLVDVVTALNKAVVGHKPLAKGRALSDPTLTRIANNHGKTTAQVALRWALQIGVCPIPKAADPARRRENFDVLDFELSEDDMDAISLLEEGFRTLDPPHAPVWES